MLRCKILLARKEIAPKSTLSTENLTAVEDAQADPLRSMCCRLRSLSSRVPSHVAQEALAKIACRIILVRCADRLVKVHSKEGCNGLHVLEFESTLLHHLSPDRAGTAYSLSDPTIFLFAASSMARRPLVRVRMLPRTTCEMFRDPWSLSWLPSLKCYHQIRYYPVCCPPKSLWVVTAGLRINEEHEAVLLGREAAREFS